MENKRNDASTTTSTIKRRTDTANFRFLLVADLHLEQPPALPDELPEAIRTKLLETAFPRLERMVDAAISQRVDAVFIAGDLLQVERSGPRMVLFLLEQLERLATRKIQVYWAGGAVDQPDRWSAVEDLKLPENVHVFPEKQFQTFWIPKNGSTDGKIVARVVGLSRSPDHDSLPRTIRLEPLPLGLSSLSLSRLDSSSLDLSPSGGSENVSSSMSPKSISSDIGTTDTESVAAHAATAHSGTDVAEAKKGDNTSNGQTSNGQRGPNVTIGAEATRREDRTIGESARVATVVLLWGPNAPRMIRHHYQPQLEAESRLASGNSRSSNIPVIPVHFWALGGRHLRGMRRLGETVLHYPGTPQGLMPEQVGTHGVSLVELDLTQQDLRKRVRVSLLPTDPVRWMSEEIRLEPGVTTAMIEQRLRERLRQLMETAEETSLMVTWKLFAEVTTIRMLRRGYATELLRLLRGDAQQWEAIHRGAANFVWNVAVEPILVGTPEKILVPETESMLRDYFAEIREIEKLAFPKGTPYDPLLDDPILPDLHSDPENDFDPDNDLAIGQDSRNGDTRETLSDDGSTWPNESSSTVPHIAVAPQSSLSSSSLSLPSRTLSEKRKNSPELSALRALESTDYPYRPQGIAEQFVLLDDFVGFSEHWADAAPSDGESPSNINTLADTASTIHSADQAKDSLSSEANGPAPAEPNLSPAPVRTSSLSDIPERPEMSEMVSTKETFIPGGDPVRWYQWLRRAAAWNETAPAMRNLLREAAMMGVDLLDHEDELNDGGKMRGLGGVKPRDGESRTAPRLSGEGLKVERSSRESANVPVVSRQDSKSQANETAFGDISRSRKGNQEDKR